MFESRLKTWRLLLCVLLALPGGLSGGAAQAHVAEAPAPQVAAMKPARPLAAAPDWADTAEPSATPYFENSLLLDGSGDYVEVPHDPALNLTDGNGFTIEAWVYRAKVGDCDTIVSKGHQSAYSVGVCNDARIWSGGSGYAGTTVIPVGVWTHIAVVQLADRRTAIYINGETDFLGTATAPLGTNTNPLFIGAEPPSADDRSEYDGNIAEVRLWNVARSQNAIRRTMHLAMDEPRPGLVAVWHLSNTSTKDSIGGHDGTLRGDASFDLPKPPLQLAYVPTDEHFNTLPAKREAAATVYVPRLDQVVLIGGQRDGTEANRIDAVDASTGELRALGRLSAHLMWAAAAYVPDKDLIYIFGGWDPVQRVRSDKIMVYNLSDGSLSVYAETLPVPLQGAAAVYHAARNKICLFGGISQSGLSRTIYLFDVATGRLSSTSFMMYEARALMAAAYSTATESIYYFAGDLGAANLDDRIYEIALSSDGTRATESLVTTARLPEQAYGLSAAEDPISKLIYLAGGGPEWISAFDPVTGQLWQTPVRLPAERRYASVAYSRSNRHLLMIGGRHNATAQSNIWRMPLGDGPAVPLGRWDFPDPVRAEVTAIDGDEKDVLVATKGNGLWHFEHDRSHSQYTPAMLGSSSGIVNDVRYNAPNNDVWAATDDAGGKLIQNSTITTYDSSVLDSNQVYAVDAKPGYTDPNGAAFFGTNQALMWQPLGAGTFWAANFWGYAIRAITHRGTGDLWAIKGGSPNLERLTYSDGGTLSETHYSAPCGPTETFRDLAFGPNGDWWLASVPWDVDHQRGGVCRIPAATTPGTGNMMQPTIGIEARSVDVDADGRVWFALGTEGVGEHSGGLTAYQAVGSPATVRTAEFNWLNGPLGSRDLVPHTIDTELWDSTITAVGAADERVWAGKEDGRLVTLAQRWQQLGESTNLSGKAIKGVWTVRGRAFLAADNILHVLAPDGHTVDSRNGVQVLAVMGDSRGRMWVGTTTDVRIYTPSGWDMLTTAEGTKPTGAIYALAEDQAGRIWIGGENGLTLYDRERFVATFTSANSDLPSDTVQALLVDRDNRLWVGTDSSLALLDGSDWHVFTPADGLPSASITDLAQLGDGRIAVSTYRICGEVPCADLYLYDGTGFALEPVPSGSSVIQSPSLTVDEVGRLWADSAVLTANGWQGYYWTNSGLLSSTVTDVSADQADRVWFSHAPHHGVSVRGAWLPPLADTVPVIAGLTPDHGKSGDVITINGTGFGGNRADVSVTIGGAAAEVVSVSSTQLKIRLRDDNTSGDVSVSVGGRRTTYGGSGRPAFCAEPVITSFTPTGGNYGVEISVFGTNFDADATLQMGTWSTPRRAAYTSPTRLFTTIQGDDSAGPIKVTNACPGGPTYTATSTQEFWHIDLHMEEVVLNQGMTSYGLVASRPTLIQHYLSHTPAARKTDRLEVDTVEVSFYEKVTEMRTYTVRLPNPVPVPISPYQATAAELAPLLKDIVNSVNVSVTPEVNDLVSPLGGRVHVHTVLKRNDQQVAERWFSVDFRRNLPLRVLLVPIMKDGYSPKNDLIAMQQHVNSGLDELRRRLMPMGRVELYWSPMVFTNKTCCLSDEIIDINNSLHLYDASHALDRARRKWNERHDPDALVAFAVLHKDVVKSGRGQALWPDISDVINKVIGDAVDTLCDIGNALLKLITFGLAGSDDGCHLEIPLYVGWARGNDLNMSHLIGHELGHIMGLVKPDAPNGSLFDNISHSVNDELDGGECNVSGVSYNVSKTLYRQPNVTDPVIDPITKQQFRPHLTKDDKGNPADQNTKRGKAIMSYACADEDDNAFFEPVDLLQVYREYAVSSTRNLIHDLRPGSGLAAAAGDERVPEHATTAPTTDIPSPRVVPGERLYVSGMVNRADNSGMLRRVEVLGESAPLDASYTTGYWLVQLDGSDHELARTGIFPIFTTPQTGLDADEGIFAATLLLQDTVARLELRHEEDVLDVFAPGGAAPSVTISSPAGGSFGSGTIPVTWTASDADGDPLEITIEYSADGGTSWTPVAFSSGSDTVQVPVVLLSGSADARFRVIASDGFHEGSATSAAFSVANQPPLPYIGQPADGSSFLEGQQITLSGGAYDNQDGSVADAGLHWHSDREGYLGSGSTLNVFLSVGSHVLSLEAENSAGLWAGTGIVVTVEGDYDSDGISDTEELTTGLSPLTPKDAYSDDDEDGLPLIMERKWGLNPENPDSDGDGRSDAEEVAAGTDPVAADDPLPPDALEAYPDSLAFEADLSLDAPLPQQQVQVVSREPVSWTLTADVEWLAASTNTGQTPTGPTILVDAFLLNEGVHVGNLTFTSDELGSSVVVPVTVSVANTGPYFDPNGDDRLNVGDVQEVAARIPSDNSQEGFSRHHDVDRDGDVDADDAGLMAERWEAERDCCGTAYPVSPFTVSASSPDAASVGDIFTVDIVTDGSQNLGGFEFDLAYDPTVLEFQEAWLGDLLGLTERTSEPIGPVVDEERGTISFGGYSYGESGGASGDGVLAEIAFRAVAEGESALDVQYPLLADVSGALTIAPDQDSTVEIVEGPLETRVRFDPREVTIAVSGTFTVEILIERVEDLYGAEVHLAFDPTQIEVVEYEPGMPIEPGPLFDPAHRSVAWNYVDNSTGQIDFAVTLLDPAPPVTGSGVLARIHFHCLGEGTSSLTFTSVVLSDRDGYPIALETQSGTVTQTAGGIITGKVLLQGRNIVPSHHSGVTVEADGVQDITDADGNYLLSVAAGTYAVHASIPGYLRSDKMNVVVNTGETVTLPDVQLEGGDANGDCLINIMDLATIAQALGSSPPSNPLADINGDNQVNIQDLSIAGGNFHKMCPSPPWTMSMDLRASALASLQSPSVLISPASSQIAVGEEITVDVRIEEVMDLYAAEVQLHFDPTVVQVQSISNGALLPGCFAARSFDNGAGTISYGCTLTGAGSGVTGSGVLAQITFQGSGGGTSDLVFTPYVGPKAVLLLDHTLAEIPVATQDISGGSITVLTERKVYLPVIARH